MNGLFSTGSLSVGTPVGAGLWGEPRLSASTGPLSKRKRTPRLINVLDQNELQRLLVERSQREVEAVPLDILSVQTTPDYVFFRRSTRHVIVNENGAFVPRSLFSPNSDIDFHINRLPDGAVSVEVFSRPSHVEGRAPVAVAGNDRSREMQWIAEHRDEYSNQWVALQGDRLLSHGNNAREVYQQGRELGIDLPFVAHVEPQDTLPFGGW